VVDSPTMHNFKLRSLGVELNHSQFVVSQSSSTVNLLRVSSRPFDHILVEGQDKLKGMRVRLYEYPSAVRSNLNSLQLSDHFEWKDRISKVKYMRSHLREFWSAVGSF
jgi:hypothetical protein